MPPTALTIAICTRDRPESLLDVLRTLSSAPEIQDGRASILVVSDGGRQPSLEEMETAAGAPVVLRTKGEGEEPGLYASRRIAAAEAAQGLLLFLDDDAHIEPDYLSRLARLAEERPDVQGFGGVDMANLPAGPGGLRLAYARLFLLAGAGPGNLSSTGFNHSQMAWRAQSSPFESDFLHGCNMAFRTEAIRDLPDVPWLRGHACTEDLLISSHAAKGGPLLVDPDLRVRHLPAEGGRGDPSQRLSDHILNHARYRDWRGGFDVPSHAWSTLGLLLRDLAMPGKRALGRAGIAAVYARAFLDLVRGTYRS